MASISSLFPFKSRDRPNDPLSSLRFALETMPGSRKNVFTPATRAEILAELYGAFWGGYAHLFLPNSNSSLPLHAMLSEVQSSLGYQGAGKEDPVIPGRPCGHIFNKGESCFRCKDCALDDSCVLCSRCFHATSHTGHNVSFFIAQQSGGCCDCGDEEAWRDPICCPFHPPDSDSASTPKPAPKQLPGEIPQIKNYPYRATFPPELRDSMSRTVGFALDFILDTLDYSPEETSVPQSLDDLRAQPTADPNPREQYCVVLWNDDKHSFDEVEGLLKELLNRTKDEAHQSSARVDDLGRDVIETTTVPSRCLEIGLGMSRVDLGVTVRRAYDTFREQISAVIIEWLLDLTRSRMGADTLILREVIAGELLASRKEGSTRTFGEISNPTRLQWLFLYHPRLWKKPRLSLKEIYATILTLSRAHKHAIAGQFAMVYHRIIDAYLLVDREAETSIKYFALQLFTVPSVALHVVREYKLIPRLLAIIASFFTNQIVDHQINYPPSSTPSVDVDSFPFKSKRFMPVFSDLRYLCHNEAVQHTIAHNFHYISDFAKMCQLFMCINPNKRVVTSHVEYETDSWISVFNVTLSLSRVIKVYGDAFARSTPAELVTAITTVVHNIMVVCTLTESRLDPDKFSSPVFHKVHFGEGVYEVIEFDVMEGWVSFHHSLHWLLAELFKHVHLLGDESLKQVGMRNLKDFVANQLSERAVLTVIDFPLRILAMIAQIRTGLWVRNGFAIRGQLLHYRDYMLRELCYDQDLYLLQTSLVLLDPDLVFVSILDRFGLVSYFSGAVIHQSYDGPQLTSMVEEVLYVIITILTETCHASRMPLRVAVRREIVHALAMGPCSFTDLVKRVAERLVDDVCFEQVLKEVAYFKSPESVADTGTYELKDEGYDEVNPFFYHYTRNKREEVETALKNRLKRKTGVTEPVLVPKPLGVIEGPFAGLAKTFASPVLLQIMFYVIYNTLVLTETTGSPPPSVEAILDQTLHLIMLALVEDGQTFSNLAATKSFDEEKNLIDALATLECHDSYKAYKPRVAWILEKMSEFVPDQVQIRRRISMEDTAPMDPAEAKRQAAKARQEAIMQKMKAQQASFAINFDGIDEADDDDMMDTSDENISYGSCIVCQEDLTFTKPFGMLAMVQASRFVRRHPDSHISSMNEVLQTTPSLDRGVVSPPPPFPPPDGPPEVKPSPNFDGFPAGYTRFGLHSSVCTHMMHLDCFTHYTSSIRQRHRSQATRNHPENIQRKEFICPLCKSLGNALLPVDRPSQVEINSVAFPDWIRSAGIAILKSRPDPLADSLQSRNGTGEFVFWSAQDKDYGIAVRSLGRDEAAEIWKMVDILMVISKSISSQTRHLRDRPEPELTERGAGLYLPEELMGYTIAAMDISWRGTGANGTVADNLTDHQVRMIRGILLILRKLAGLHFSGRPDDGRSAIQQLIIKRLLPEWSRTSLSSFSYPLLLRDPFTILVETAAIAPETLRHVLILTYYACLARTVIGLVYILNKTRSSNVTNIGPRAHEDLFGNIRVFFMSVVRHSPVFEHTANLVFDNFGEARMEKLLYMFTLTFLRRAAILCRAVAPHAFPPPPPSDDSCEYRRLLTMLQIPPLSTLPEQDTLQNALSGWCAHYGHSHAASQLNCGVILDFPGMYKLAKLPVVLDNLFTPDRPLVCSRCKTIPSDGAICLVCGALVCAQSHCCRDKDYGDRGECNMHTRECGGIIGMYFVIKRCQILYLHADNGTFAPSPYLDIHGEVDISMRRGRRQYLHHARWEDARKTWMNHGIPTVIARKLESTVDNGGWETL